MLTTLIVIAAVCSYCCSLLTPATCFIAIAISIIIINIVPPPYNKQSHWPYSVLALLSPHFNASPSLAPPLLPPTHAHTQTHTHFPLLSAGVSSALASFYLHFPHPHTPHPPLCRISSPDPHPQQATTEVAETYGALLSTQQHHHPLCFPLVVSLVVATPLRLRAGHPQLVACSTQLLVCGPCRSLKDPAWFLAGSRDGPRSSIDAPLGLHATALSRRIRHPRLSSPGGLPNLTGPTLPSTIRSIPPLPRHFGLNGHP